MRVHNLTKKDLEYRGKVIKANGGFIEINIPMPLPARDKKLEDNKVLAFGLLPSWWIRANKVSVTVTKGEVELTKEVTTNVEEAIPLLEEATKEPVRRRKNRQVE